MPKKKVSIAARATAALLTISSIGVTLLAVHPATATVGHTTRASEAVPAAVRSVVAPVVIPRELPDSAHRATVKRYARAARKKPAPADTSGFGWPVLKDRITVPFGWRHKFVIVDRKPVRVPGREFHHGVDIACVEGRPVHASEGGFVILSGVNPDYGNLIALSNGKGWSTLYGHMELRLKYAGQRVQKGQVIGLCGMSGRATGPHLHFEIRRNGQFFDPLRFLS